MYYCQCLCPDDLLLGTSSFDCTDEEGIDAEGLDYKTNSWAAGIYTLGYPVCTNY